MANTPNRMEKHWDVIVPFLKRTWTKLTDVDLEEINGRYDRLILKIKDIYGGAEPIMQEARVKATIQAFLNDLEHVNS